MKNKGIIATSKPKDWTSFDVVNKLKFKLKPNKVGHLGTLDPMAEGVLLITVGKATKLFDRMQEKTKTYVATFEFGYVTDTLDATGETTEKTNIIPTKEQILSILPEFIGKISQIPPKYSAKSINGKRAYDLARNNVEFELKAKIVDVFDIKLLNYENNLLTLEIKCGSGTYIRSIGRDIAHRVNSLATMTSLVRTKVGNFELSDCIDVRDDLDFDKIIMPIKSALNYVPLKLSKEDQARILNGQTLILNEEDGIYMLEDEIDVVALVEIKEKHAKMSVFLN